MSFFWLRTSSVIVAAFIGAAALWILTTEAVRPRPAYFPANSNEVVAFDASLAASASAAHIGRIRGDLWASAAVTEAAPLLFEPTGEKPSAASQTKIERAQEAIQHAANLSPHDSRVWLVLAGLRSRQSPPDPSAAEALKLSYYTGPNEFALAPIRLAIAGRVTADEELQGQVQAEIQRIILKRPDLKPAIAAAYKTAVAKSRELFEATLEEADPNFLATIRSAPK